MDCPKCLWKTRHRGPAPFREAAITSPEDGQRYKYSCVIQKAFTKHVRQSWDTCILVLRAQTHLQERTLCMMLTELNWRVMKLGISSVCLHNCSLQEERPLISFFRDICFCSSCLFPYGIAVWLFYQIEENQIAKVQWYHSVLLAFSCFPIIKAFHFINLLLHPNSITIRHVICIKSINQVISGLVDHMKSFVL